MADQHLIDLARARMKFNEQGFCTNAVDVWLALCVEAKNDTDKVMHAMNAVFHERNTTGTREHELVTVR